MILWFFYVCGLEEIIDNHSEFEAHVLMLGNKVFLHNTMHKAHPTVSAFDKTKAALDLQSRIDDVITWHKLQTTQHRVVVSPDFDRAVAKRHKISEPNKPLFLPGLLPLGSDSSLSATTTTPSSASVASFSDVASLSDDRDEADLTMGVDDAEALAENGAAKKTAEQSGIS